MELAVEQLPGSLEPATYGYWRPIIEQSVSAYLKCGDLQEGFARVHCPDRKHEMFVAFSCKQRCTCPSCHQKRTLLTALYVSQNVCSPVAHRQVVLTIPQRVRVHTRFDRKLLGKFSSRMRFLELSYRRNAIGFRRQIVPWEISMNLLHRTKWTWCRRVGWAYCKPIVVVLLRARFANGALWNRQSE